jgi:hypothetical protein
MAALPADGNITADGDYDITVSGGIRYDVNITGTFGGGTVTVSEQNPAALTQYGAISTSAAITSDFSDVLLCRNGSTIRFSLAGATTPNIYVHIAPVRNG